MEKIFENYLCLNGRNVRMEMYSEKHAQDLIEHLYPDENSWHRVHWGVNSLEDFKDFLLRPSLTARERKVAVPLVMIDKNSGKAVGISNYMNINIKHRWLEIGGTWIGSSWHKSYVNTEAKFLMLQYAFEVLGCHRVEFRADSLNFNSQRAIMRLGAKYEGEIRQFRLLADGRKRDYKIYSILDCEWSNVKGSLEWYMRRPYAGPRKNGIEIFAPG